MSVAALYSGPYYGPSDPEGRGPDSGPYIVALKRGLSRWSGGEELAWQEFNPTYNKALEAAVLAFKKHKSINTEKWVWGQAAHEALETALRQKGTYDPPQPALDATALILMEDAYDLKFPQRRDLKAVRASLAEYLRQMVYYNASWRYVQQRPMKSIGVPPSYGGSDDCSSLPVAGCYYARTKTGIFVPDPTGYAYRGYGNSVTLYVHNMSRKLGLSATFEVGDIACYGPQAMSHITQCRQRGTKDTSIWTSHGSSAGPNDCRLLYRGDLYAVVRPILVP